MRQLVRRCRDERRVGEGHCLGKRVALLLFGLLPPSEFHQDCRDSQALGDSRSCIAQAIQRVPQKGQSGFGESLERKPLLHLREPMGKLLELAASVCLPGRDHLLDFREIVGRGRVARNDAGNRPAHFVSGQRRGFEHIARCLLGDSAAGEDPGDVELRARSLRCIAGFAQVVESSFRVGAAFLEELLAQLAALLLAGGKARVEETEELEQEGQALARAAGEIHREPDIEETLANRVEA